MCHKKHSTRKQKKKNEKEETPMLKNNLYTKCKLKNNESKLKISCKKTSHNKQKNTLYFIKQYNLYTKCKQAKSK